MDLTLALVVAMITVAAAAARTRGGPRLTSIAATLAASRSGPGRGGVQGSVEGWDGRRLPAELATQAEEAHARARTSTTHRGRGMTWGMLVVRRQGLEPRTVALRAPNGWSQDLQRTVGNSHLPGSLLAGTIRC